MVSVSPLLPKRLSWGQHSIRMCTRIEAGLCAMNHWNLRGAFSAPKCIAVLSGEAAPSLGLQVLHQTFDCNLQSCNRYFVVRWCAVLACAGCRSRLLWSLLAAQGAYLSQTWYSWAIVQGYSIQSMLWFLQFINAGALLTCIARKYGVLGTQERKKRWMTAQRIGTRQCSE